MPLMVSNIKESEMPENNLYKDLKNDKAADSNVVSVACEKSDEPGKLIKADSKSLKKNNVNLKSQYESKQIFESEEDLITETTGLNHDLEPSKSLSDDATLNDNYFIVPGTVKRGKKKEQSVDIVLKMSREQLETLESQNRKVTCACLICNMKCDVGFHVLLWSILCFPFSLIISGVYSFYMGTITWYNIFKFFAESKSVWYRILFPVFLIALYAFLIIPVSLGLGLYAGVRQLSCCWNSWVKEFTDYEKGFYGWLCNALDIPDCSPYEVIILSSVQKT